MMIFVYYSIILAFVFISSHTYAQRKVRDMSDSYDRNGLTVLAITHGDSYDREIVNALKQASRLDKYDLNDIGIYECRVSYSRKAEQDKKPARENEIRDLITKNDYGEKILSFLYNRKPDGTLDHSLISRRGRYNATDVDFQLAQARKLGESVLADYGFNLIQNSYLLLIDFTNIEKETDKNGNVVYKSKVESFLYRINYDDDLNTLIFDNWIYEDDTPDMKVSKKEAYDKLRIGMTRQTGNAPLVSGKNIPLLVQNGTTNVFYGIESSLEAFMVKMGVSAVKPIRAKIGKKEGVKNTDRYFAYRYVEDAKGDVTAVRAGVVRATTITDNRYDAVGETGTSEFFQIHGGRIEEGNTLVQKNDLRLGLTTGYHYGGLNGLDVKLDFLAAINTQGISHYVLMDLNFDFYKPETT